MESTLLIDNRSVPATGGRTFERLNPIGGSVVTRAAAASVEDAIAAINSCAVAFDEWRLSTPERRRNILLKAADLLSQRVSQFTDVMTAETGAASGWVEFNVHTSIGMLQEAAGITSHIKGEVIPGNKPGMFAMATRRPAGVVLSIAPWNAPIILAVRSFCTALACGNTVLLKASEVSPGTQYLLAELMRDAGLPNGVLNLITHAPADASRVVEAMIAHPAVRRVNFTGSTRTGRLIAQTAAKYLKPVLLELGGKAPMLVLKDADVPNAVRAAAFGAFMHQGQICMSTERIVVDDSIADDFVARLTAKATTLLAGDPLMGTSPLGCLIGLDSATRVQELVDDAQDKGAILTTPIRGEGILMNAAVIDRVTPQMKLYHEESFGPVVAIVRVANAEEAIRVANDTEFGLSSSIFTRDVKRALDIAARLDFGCCHINGPTVHDEPQMPLGGMKASGYGRFGGLPGIHEFTEVQWISIEDPDQHYPI